MSFSACLRQLPRFAVPVRRRDMSQSSVLIHWREQSARGWRRLDSLEVSRERHELRWPQNGTPWQDKGKGGSTWWGPMIDNLPNLDNPCAIQPLGPLLRVDSISDHPRSPLAIMLRGSRTSNQSPGSSAYQSVRPWGYCQVFFRALR